MNPRIHGLDACRAAAMMLGLFFHGAVSFISIDVGWATRDRSTHVGVDAFLWICHSFRMPVFFLLAGFFGRLIYEKRGPAGFVRHRAKRLLLPFVVTLIPLMPSLYFLWTWGLRSGGPRSLHRLGMELPSLDPASLPPSPGPLWFLYYLLMIFALAVPGLALADRLPLEGLKRRADALLGVLVRTRVVIFAMALPTALTLYFMKALEVETPIDFIPQLRILAYYSVFVGFGWLLQRQTELMESFGTRLWFPLLVALAVLVPLGILVDRMAREGSIGPSASRLGALYLSALFSWSLVVLFLGAFVKWGGTPRPWVAWLSDASYWCYLVHLPVVVAMQILLSRLEWPGPLKYALIMAVTLAACLGSYQLFVRRTFVGEALNGRRGPAVANL